MKRVVVTGMGCITSLGQDWAQVKIRLQQGRNAIRFMPEWECYDGLFTKLAGPVEFD